MRILSVYIKNINSLKGEFTLNFDKEPFTTHSLFAIVGTTGSGKTTILDAITLALYGKVFRYGKDAPRDKVITYGEKEASVEIVFMGKDNIKYACLWSIRYTRTGNIDTAKREIADITQNPKKILATKIADIDAVIEKAIGLKYDQFTRSVILPQGNFAAFLKANENEKASILEYITGTEKFSEISKLTFQIHKQEKQKLESLTEKLSNFVPLTEEEKTTTHQEINTLQQKNQELHAEEQKLSEQKSLHLQITQLNDEIEQLRNQKNQLEEQFEAHAQEFGKYEFYLKHENIYQIYEKTREKQEHKQIKEQELQTHTQDLEQIIPQYEQHTHTLNQLETEIQQITENIQIKEPVWQEAKAIQKTIENYSAQIKEIERNIEQHQKTLSNQHQKIESETQQLQELTHQQNELKKWIETHPQYAQLSQNESLIENYYSQSEKYTKELKTKQTEYTQLQSFLQKTEQEISTLLSEQQQTEQKKQEIIQTQTALDSEIEQLHEQLPDTTPDFEKILSLKKLHQTAEQYLKSEQYFAKLKKDHEKYHQALQKVQQEQTQSKEKELELEKIIEKKRKQIELEHDIEELSHYRIKLKKGEPCPLCGATEHPFASRLSSTLSQLKEELENYTEAYQELQTQIKALSVQKEDYQAKIQANETQQQEVQSQINQYKEEFATLNTYSFEITQPEAIKTHITELEKEYKQYQQIQENIQLKQKERKEITQQLQKTIERQQTLTEKNTMLISQQKEHETRLKNIHEQIHTLNFEIEQIHNKLQQLYPDYTVQTTLSSLKKLIAQYQQQQALLHELSVKAEMCHTNIKNYQEQIEKKQKDIAEEQTRFENAIHLREEQSKILHQLIPEGSVEQEEKLYRNNLQQRIEQKENLFKQGKQIENKITELNTLIKSTQNELKLLETEIEQHTQSIDKVLQEKKITHQMFENAYLTPAARVSIKSHYDRYTKSMEETQTLLSNKNEKTGLLQKQINPALSFENIISTLEQLKQAMELNSQNIGKLIERLEKDEHIRKEQTELYTQIEKQQKTLQKWAELNELIGSEKGDKFRKFAQGLTLAKLTVLANQHLKNLNARYSLRKKPNEELELEVIDSYQADEARDISSLSGGETFLVSLALALGLSDLVGKDAHIGSLFIDEGFGTLDPETLDIAITALENLQMSGKIIGVISHVEALKERIHAKIILEKTNEGTSNIKIFPSR